MRYLKSLFNPMPSLFDVCVGGFLFITTISGDTNRAVFIVLYTAFLLAFSFGMRPKREYKSLPLALLVVWSFLNIFIHSFAIYPHSRTSLYPAMYIMEEGFIYILFGVIFLHTVIRYSTNIRFVYFLIPFAILRWIPGMVYLGNSTPIVAIGLSIVIYLFLSKRFKIAIPATILGLLGIVYKWSWLCMKFRCRPYVWYQLFVNSFYHPVRYLNGNIVDTGVELSPALEKFVAHHSLTGFQPWLASLFGSGFTQFLNSEYTWVGTTIWNKLGHHKTYTFGWVHLQNDYFHISMCLGSIVLIPVFWFIIQSAKTIGIRPVLILFMFVVLMCSAKLIMFNPGFAGIALMMSALTITDGVKNKGDVI